MFQNRQKVVVVSSGDPARVIKVQAVSGVDAGRYPTVDTTGVTGRDQQVQIVSGGDETRFPKLQGLADARSTADSVISALTPAAWYRNATGVTSAGGFASQWDDYSGNTRHLVQATGTNQPAYSAGVFTFDGADNRMTTAGFTLNQPTTIALRFAQLSWTASDRITDGNTASTGAVYQKTATPKISIYAGGSEIPATGQTGMVIGDYATVVAIFNGASSSIQINSDAAATGNAGAANMGGFALGAYGGAGPVGFAHIGVKEAILFPTAISGADLTNLIACLDAI